MGKGTFFTGQPVFNQILSLIPRFKVAQLAQKHNADRYCKKFRAYDHLVTMLYSTYHQCNSLREVITRGGRQGRNRPQGGDHRDASFRKPPQALRHLFHTSSEYAG